MVSNVNLDDFGNWKLLYFGRWLPAGLQSEGFATFNGTLHSVLMIIFGVIQITGWVVHYENGSTLEFLTHEGTHLLAGFRYRIVYFHPDGTQGIIIGNCVERLITLSKTARGACGLAMTGCEMVFACQPG